MENKLFKKTFFLLITLLFLSSCATLKTKDQETFGNVLYKNLKKKSEKVSDAYITGMFKISGINEIPPVFMEFQLTSRYAENYVFFRIRILNKNVIDIVINKNDVYIVNNVEKKYYKTDIEKIDFSKVIGINFNPLDVSYFFLGLIPNNDKMELINFKKNKNNFTLNISDSASKYTIDVNNREAITKVKIFNQYFDTLILESITYREDIETGMYVPNMFNFSSENKKIKISFIINRIKLNANSGKKDIKSIIGTYQETLNAEEIKIDVDKFKNFIK
jgi:hypothetical protein